MIVLLFCMSSADQTHAKPLCSHTLCPHTLCSHTPIVSLHLSKFKPTLIIKLLAASHDTDWTALLFAYLPICRGHGTDQGQVCFSRLRLLMLATISTPWVPARTKTLVQTLLERRLR